MAEWTVSLADFDGFNASQLAYHGEDLCLGLGDGFGADQTLFAERQFCRHFGKDFLFTGGGAGDSPLA